MNKILYFLLALLITFSSCKSNDPADTLEVNPKSLSFDFLGGVSILDVITTASSYTCTSNKDWCTVVISGNKITVTVSGNPTDASRSAIVQLKIPEKTLNVNLTQTGSAAILRDSIALTKFKLLSATTGWTAGTPMNTWAGVKVELVGGERRVTELDLHGKSLAGAVPVEIKDLTELTYLDLSDNALTGNLPPMGTLTKLIVLDLSINKLTGSLPADITSSTSLAYLSMGQNKFTGALPAQYSSLTALSVLDLGINNLTDAIPTSWSALTKLRYFYLYGNTLSGSIPSYISTFSKLINLSLEYNNLTGSIPTGIGGIATLTDLTLSKNRLTGAIPADLSANANWNTWKTDVLNQQTGYVLSQSAPSQVKGMSSAKVQQMNSIQLKAHVLPAKNQFYK